MARYAPYPQELGFNSRGDTASAGVRPPAASRSVPGRALDPLRVALFVFMLLALGRVHQHFPLIASLQPAFLLAAFVAGYIFLNPHSVALGNAARPWPAQWLWAMGILACASVPFGIAMGRSASFFLHSYSKTLIFAAFLMVATRRARDLFLFVWAFVAACGILSFLMIFVFEMTRIPGDLAVRLSGLYTYDANDAALVLTVGLPLTLLTLQTSKTTGKALSALVFCGMGVALARSGSRGAFIGLVFVGLALLISWPRASLAKRLAVLGAVLLTLHVAAPLGYWDRMGTLLNPTEDYNWDSINGRKAVALRGIGYMLDHPFFGVGIGNFERAEGTISEKAKEHHPAQPLRWTPPHNSFIQVGAELGIPGLFLWWFLLVGGLVAPIRLRRRLPPEWVYGNREERFLYLCTVYLPISFLGFAVTSSFLSFAYMDPAYVLASYLTGLYASIAVKRWRDREAAETRVELTSEAATAATRSRDGVAVVETGRP